MQSLPLYLQAILLLPACLVASSAVAQDMAAPQGQTNPANAENIVKPKPAETPESGSVWKRKYAFGDWNGYSKRLEEKGVVFDFYYTDDALGNPYGSRADFGVWGRIRGTVDVDFSKFTKFTRVQGLTFHMTGLWQYGTDLSKQYTFTAVDSTSLPSAHTFRADSYFLQQYFLHHKLAIRGGQIAAYDSYSDSEYGASFINLALGYAHSNLNSAAYLSFNPAGVPAFELKALPTDHVYAKAMVMSEERSPYTIIQTASAFTLAVQCLRPKPATCTTRQSRPIQPSPWARNHSSPTRKPATIRACTASAPGMTRITSTTCGQANPRRATT